MVRIVQIKQGWTFWWKPSRAQRWWDWTRFSTTGTQQLHQDQHLTQTVGTVIPQLTLKLLTSSIYDVGQQLFKKCWHLK